MEKVSIQDVRFDFPQIRRRLESGEQLLLTFRNRPLAKLVPVMEEEIGRDDPALSFASGAENADPISNHEIDSLIYG